MMFNNANHRKKKERTFILINYTGSRFQQVRSQRIRTNNEKFLSHLFTRCERDQVYLVFQKPYLVPWTSWKCVTSHRKKEQFCSLSHMLHFYENLWNLNYQKLTLWDLFEYIQIYWQMDTGKFLSCLNWSSFSRFCFWTFTTCFAESFLFSDIFLHSRINNFELSFYTCWTTDFFAGAFFGHHVRQFTFLFTQ